MSDAKIGFTVGGISFTGEGENIWLEKQLDKIIEKAPELIKILPKIEEEPEKASKVEKEQDKSIAAQTLPNFLKLKNAASNQLQKFLATAIWLHTKGNKRLSTSDVSKALKESNQSRLGNASDCLAKNIAKGYIERDGTQFYVTEEGKAGLG